MSTPEERESWPDDFRETMEKIEKFIKDSESSCKGETCGNHFSHMVTHIGKIVESAGGGILPWEQLSVHCPGLSHQKFIINLKVKKGCDPDNVEASIKNAMPWLFQPVATIKLYTEHEKKKT